MLHWRPEHPPQRTTQDRAIYGNPNHHRPDDLRGPRSSTTVLQILVLSGHPVIERYREDGMGVIDSKIQAVEDMYQLIWTAVASKRPISAVYKDRFRLFCPHRLGRNREGKRRVLCYQYGGDSETGLAPAGSSENWRCVVFEKLRRVEQWNC